MVVKEASIEFANKNKELCERYQKGDTNAGTELYLCNLPLIRKVMQNNMHLLEYDYDADDMLQQGAIGLLVAAQKYDPAKKTAFSTYAYNWIRLRMQRGHNTMHGSIHLPIDAEALYISFLAKSGTKAGSEEFMHALAQSALSRNDKQTILYCARAQNLVSFESLVLCTDDSASEVASDFKLAESTASTEDIAMVELLKGECDDLLGNLSPLEEWIVRHRVCTNPYTLEECVNRCPWKYNGKKLTIAQVESIQAKAMYRLRIMADNAGLKEYIE